MKVVVAVLGSPSQRRLMVSVADVKHDVYLLTSASEFRMLKSRGPIWAHRPNKPDSFCGRKATQNELFLSMVVVTDSVRAA